MSDDPAAGDEFGVSEAAQLTGVAEATLRVWEKHYHWPRPRRAASGFRIYNRGQIAELKRLADLIANGFRISEIVLDGEPHWPTALAPKPERPSHDFSVIPLPTDGDALRIRHHLEDAIHAQDQGAIAWARAQLDTLRPRDRGPAGLDLLILAGLAAPSDGIGRVAPSHSSSSTKSQEPSPMSTEPTAPNETPTPVTAITPEPETLVATGAPVASTATGSFDLAGALRTKMTAEALSISAAAKAIDVSPIAVGNILSKGSRPNARTAARFAAWLGVDAALLTGGATSDAPKPARTKPARKAADKTAKKDPAEAKPAKSAAPRAPKRKNAGLSTDEVLAIVRAAIEAPKAAEKPAAPHPILKDALAMMVHEASADLRSALKAMMSLASKHK